MSQAAAYLTLLLLTLLATLHLGRTWVEEDIDEQFYSLSAIDATGQSIPMSSYVGKVMWKCAVSRLVITVNLYCMPFLVVTLKPLSGAAVFTVYWLMVMLVS